MPTQVIPFESIDKIGLYADTPSIALPPGAFSDVLNVRFDDGSIRKVRGNTELFEMLTLTNLQFITYWPNPNRPIWVVVNRQGNPLADHVYAITVTGGTASATNISQNTTTGYPLATDGIAINWQATLFNGGYTLIMNPANGIPQHATDALGSTSLPSLRNLDGWQSYNGNPDQTASQPVTAVTAGIVVSFGNVLLAGDLRETRTVSGNPVIRDLRGVVRSSNAAAPGSIPTIWNPFETGAGTADEIIVADTGRITAMVPLQGRMMVYTNNSITQISVSAQGLSEINITREYGALSFGTVFEFDGRHIVLGSNDIYQFEGHPSSIQSIADGRIRRDYYDNVHNEAVDLTQIVRNQTWDELWVCYRSADNPRATFNQALTWNYRNNTWSRRLLPDYVSVAVGPITGGGVAEDTLTFAGGNTGVQSTGRPEIQDVTISGNLNGTPATTDVQHAAYTGTRSNAIVVGPEELATITLPTNFNSGPTASANSTRTNEASTTNVNIGSTGAVIEVDDSPTFTGPDEAVILPATGASIPNPTTATYNPTVQFQFINWAGRVDPNGTLSAYRVRTNSRGAAGARINDTGPFTNRDANNQTGWTTGFESGVIVGTPRATASNMPNPVTANGGFTASGGTSSNGNVKGVRQSGTSGSQGPAVAVSSRSANAGSPWSGSANPHVARFSSSIAVFNSVTTTAPTNLRLILQGPTATYPGRRARVRNTNSFPITITGNIQGTTVSTVLAAGASTSYVTNLAGTISWNITASSTSVAYSFDPDTSNSVFSQSINNVTLPANQNANSAASTIATAINNLTGITASSSSNVVSVNLGRNNVESMFSLNNSNRSGMNLGSNHLVVSQQGNPTVGTHSIYTVTSPAGDRIMEISGSVSSTSGSDLATINTQILAFINSSTSEQPINFNGTNDTANNRLVLTGVQTGASGNWSITTNNQGQTSNAGNIQYVVSKRDTGTDRVPPAPAVVTFTDPANSSTHNVTVSAPNTDVRSGDLNATQIAAQISSNLSVSGWADAPVGNIVRFTRSTVGPIVPIFGFSSSRSVVTGVGSQNQNGHVATRVGSVTITYRTPGLLDVVDITTFSNRTPAQIATEVNRQLVARPDFRTTYTAGSNVVTVEPLELGRNATSFTIAVDPGTTLNSTTGNAIDQTTTVTRVTVSEADVERPWPTGFINTGINYVVGVEAGRISASDVTDASFGGNIQSYVERKNIHVQPTKETEMIQTLFIDTMGTGTDAEFTIRLRVTNAAGQQDSVNLSSAGTGNTAYTFDYNGDDSDYKTDVRLTGRILNYRIEDNSQNEWSIASIAMEVGQGGTR